MTPDEFALHPLWAQIDITKAHLSEFEKSSDAEQLTNINRIRFITNYARSFDSVPSEYFTATMLNKVQNAWTNVIATLEQFAGNPLVQFLIAAVVEVEKCLELIVQWPSPLTKGDSLAQVTKTFRAYATDLENSREHVGEKNNQVMSSLHALEQRLETSSAVLDGTVTKNVEALASLESKIIIDENRIEDAIEKYEALFQASEKSRDLTLRE